MPLSISGPVGLRNLLTPLASRNADQNTILILLSEIPVAQGGLAGAPGKPPEARPDGKCAPELAKAIWDFQNKRRNSFKEGLGLDGVVDPGGKTLAKLNALAPHAGQMIRPSGVQVFSPVQQMNPPALADDHHASYNVVSPLAAGNKYYMIPIEPYYRNLLFRVEHNGRVFWIGAGVPSGTQDFNKVQVYFHPTVVNSGVTHARDSDYEDFKCGWSGHMQDYTVRAGLQIAAARRVVVLVPFNTMGAHNGGGANMFATNGVGLINKVMAAIQGICDPYNPIEPLVTQIGVTSFSNGIAFLKLFLRYVGSSGLIREITDLDSPYIIGFPHSLTHLSGAVSRCFSQVPQAGREPGYVYMPGDRFPRGQTVHARIGWEVYYTAMLTSVIV